MSRWRQGTHDPKIVRRQLGAEPNTGHVTEGGDDSIAYFRKAHDAALAVRSVNTALDPLEGTPPDRVPATLFKASGSYAYMVLLDYTGGPDGYIEPAEHARQALRRATDAGTSEVTMREVPPTWFLVVPAPPEGYPVMVIGRG